MAFIIDKDKFEELKGIERAADGVYTRKTMKINIMDKLMEAVSVRWDRLKKVTYVIDEIVYMLTDRGFSFIGRDKLSKKCDCSLSTVDKAIRLIKNSAMFVVAYRENKNSNGCKTPVIIYLKHKNFNKINEVLNISEEARKQQEAAAERMSKNNEENKVESNGSPWYDWVKGTKKVSTNSFTKKHENIENDIYDVELIMKSSKISTSDIVRYLYLNIADFIKSGGRIKHLSTYCENKFAHIVGKSGAIKRNKPVKRQETTYTGKVPFYNWLEQ